MKSIGLLLLFSSMVNAQSPLPPAQLINDIKAGGYVLYVRHATTNHSQKDSNRKDFSDCASQRNLSAQGRQDAVRIGLVIKQLGIPIAKVITSPYCRAKDTAMLMFKHAEVDNNLQFSISKNAAESKKLGAYLKQVMTAAKPASTNHVFVGHTSNLRDGLGVWPKPEGVMVVFKPTQEGLKFKGMIKPADWP